MGIDIDFDVELTDFSIAEVDLVLDIVEPQGDGAPADDTLPSARTKLPELSRPILRPKNILYFQGLSGGESGI